MDKSTVLDYIDRKLRAAGAEETVPVRYRTDCARFEERGGRRERVGTSQRGEVRAVPIPEAEILLFSGTAELVNHADAARLSPNHHERIEFRRRRGTGRECATLV